MDVFSCHDYVQIVERSTLGEVLTRTAVAVEIAFIGIAVGYEIQACSVGVYRVAYGLRFSCRTGKILTEVMSVPHSLRARVDAPPTPDTLTTADS